jgi:hypothetical protein
MAILREGVPAEYNPAGAFASWKRLRKVENESAREKA